MLDEFVELVAGDDLVLLLFAHGARLVLGVHVLRIAPHGLR